MTKLQYCSLIIFVLINGTVGLGDDCICNMYSVDGFCGPRCVGDTGCSQTMPSYLDFALGMDFGLQGPTILVGCDDAVPAHAVIWDPDPTDNLVGPVLEDINDVFFLRTDYSLLAVFDGSIFCVNGSTQPPVSICPGDEIHADLINHDPETISRARQSQILIYAQGEEKGSGYFLALFDKFIIFKIPMMPTARAFRRRPRIPAVSPSNW